MIKKNLLKSITAFIIVAILAFSIVGCKKTDNSESDSVNVSNSGGGAEPIVENENHRFSYKETNEYLIKNGTTEYKIVIPSENVSAELNIARDELVRLFKEATGVTLETVSDEGKSHDANGKYISLGNTSLYKSSGLSVDTKTLKKDGARILTKDKTIYFIGKTDTGVINGVYDFLNMHFNFETYFKDTYTLTTGVTELKLMNYDVVDIPDIEYRTKKGILNASTSDVNDMMFAYRMRSLDSDSNMLLPIHSGNSKNSDWNINHNSFYFLPLDEYFETKRNFYSVAGNQLCFTAHGNTDDFNLMVDLCAEKITNSLTWYDPESYPNYNAVEFGINDFFSLCECDACKNCASRNNGAKSASIIIFLNKVGKKVNDWMDANPEYKREGFKYVFLAYADALQPPFRNYSTGEWKMSDEVKSPEGVNLVPFVAQDKFNYSKSLYDADNNSVRRFVEDWAAVYDNCMAWSYGTFFHDYLCFYDSFGFYSEYYKLLKENKYMYTFAQIHDCQRGADTGFGVLHNYLCSKLAWNSDLDVNKLVDNYFKAMYKDAWVEMKELFTQESLWFATENARTSLTTSSSVTSTEKDKLPFGTVNDFMKTIDKAYAKIESYKRDTATYNRLKNNIDMEWMFPAKAMLSLHKDKYTTAEYEEMKQKFKTVAQTLNFAVIKETWLNQYPTTIDEYLETIS